MTQVNDILYLAIHRDIGVALKTLSVLGQTAGQRHFIDETGDSFINFANEELSKYKSKEGAT